jgi:hypothetical protein
LVLLFMAIVVAFMAVLVTGVLLDRRRMSKRVAALRDHAAHPPTKWIWEEFGGALPTETESYLRELTAMQFQRVVVLRADDAVRIILWSSNGVIADLCHDPDLPKEQLVVLQLITPLDGVEGELCTSTAALVLDLWPGEIGQVFPDDSTAELAARHEEAMRYLAVRGLRARILSPEEAPRHVEWATRSSMAATAGASRHAIVSELRRVWAGKHAALGPIQSNPKSLARIDALLAGRVPLTPAR